jgi:hypothetical protein
MPQTADTELVICSRETQAEHPELFHYTKPAAFEGIIRSNSFWASHYADMADKTEVLLMRDQLPGAIAPQFEKIVSPLNRHDRRLFKAAGGGIGTATNFVESVYGATFLSKSAFTALDAFMVSFSTHAKDTDFEREHGLQSQWKDYAGLNGFCLIFDTVGMAHHLGNEMDSRYWVRLTLDSVRYSGVPVEELFPELVYKSADTLRQFLLGTRFPEMAVPEFLAGATLLKNRGYESEREIRIVAIPGTKRLNDQAAKDRPDVFKVLPIPTVRKRPDSGGRYVSVFEDLTAKMPLKRVIVGPSNRQAQNAELARSLVGTVPVTLSRCPAWDTV